MKSGSNYRIWLWAVLVLLNGWGCHHFSGHAVTEPAEAQMGDRVVIFQVVGKGVEPEQAMTKGQALLMAERAAIADGHRQLVEKIRGVYVNAHTKSGYGAVNRDAVNTQTQSWLRGAQVVEIRQSSYGIVEAHMRLHVNFVNRHMIWWPFGVGTPSD